MENAFSYNSIMLQNPHYFQAMPFSKKMKLNRKSKCSRKMSTLENSRKVSCCGKILRQPVMFPFYDLDLKSIDLENPYTFQIRETSSQFPNVRKFFSKLMNNLWEFAFLLKPCIWGEFSSVNSIFIRDVCITLSNIYNGPFLQDQ